MPVIHPVNLAVFFFAGDGYREEIRSLKIRS